MAVLNKNSIFWRLFIPFIVIYIIGILIAFIYIPRLLEQNVIQNAVVTAENNVKQFKVLRKYYVNNVIKKVLKGSDLKPSFNHQEDPGAVPLPATLIHDLSELLTEAGTSLKLYSAYPFPNRAGRENDQFGNDAWAALSIDTGQSFVKVENIAGITNVRVGIADTMVSSACVSCHNSHPLTPKNDWQLDDLRGVLEINIPIDDQLAAVNQVSMLVVSGIIIAALMFMGIFFFTYQMFIQKKLTDINEALSDIAEGDGDLTKRIKVEGKDEVSLIAGSFNLFIEKLQIIIRDLNSYTLNLSAAAEQVSIISEQTNTSLQDQHMQTDQLATAMNEMTATVQEVALNAQTASHSAETAKTQTSEGFNIVKQSITQIDSLATNITTAAEAIKQLEKDSEIIGGVLDVIKGIAEQTNLLALNAAIEAARAGEQGRGFAVVADEVRTLASRTQESTSEIERMIQQLQSASKNAVVEMGNSQESSSAGKQKMAEAGSALSKIQDAVDSISEQNLLIASAAEEQNNVAEEINRNVVTINTVGESTAEGAKQTSASSIDLADIANKLQQLVQQFKV
ncbi:MAG: methyl-accepting chemotaxis protein [endosymbiont of Galathealinum brachiosum]|uniref:Methyl-accepting chemotaxis protein n=1 Tax=endosymbiont of Galathealinum brachiosum TaxID=2200906 RepID=A0A370DLJ3_9GAMM|nr:MAG: methyl-accepting chemotaxis protein [endosymbiont of Galathealinum brachiosum]